MPAVSAQAFARKHAIPSVTVTGGAFELGQQVVLGLQAVKAAPVILAGNWFCGAALMVVLDLCARFDQVDRVFVGIVIDRLAAKSGPATTADFVRISAACATMPRRRDGRFEWVKGDAEPLFYRGVGGRRLQGTPAVSIDAVTIGVITGAANVTVLETWEASLSSSAGGPACDEIVVEVSGRGRDGAPLTLRREVVASRDDAPLTAIAIALLLEQAAGLGTRALGPGLYLPEQALDPAAACAAMQQAGVAFSDVTAKEAGFPID